jgi:DNA-directed RNA polymerase specialized sigma24 family protein
MINYNGYINLFRDIFGSEPIFNEGDTERSLRTDLDAVITTIPRSKDEFVIRKNYIDDMKITDISRELGVTRQMVYMRKRRSLRMLRHPTRVRKIKRFCFK